MEVLVDKDNIEGILDRWTDLQHILLMAGEMMPHECQTVLAVTNAMAREIRKELEDDYN